jgi:chromosome partitioning protein
MSNTVEIQPMMLITDIVEYTGTTNQNIHKIAKERGANTQKIGRRAFVQHLDTKILLKNDIPKKVISVQTSKGGVGKTTITLNLAIRSWLYGAKVLIVDIDQQSNLTRTLLKDRPKNVFIDILKEESDVKAKDCIVNVLEGLDILPSSINNAMLNQHMAVYGLEKSKAVKNALKDIRDDYDIIIIDCPPAVGPIVSSATYYSDLVIAPIDPDEYAIDGMKYSYNEVKKINEESKYNIEFKILLNKFDARTMLSSGVASQLQSDKKLAPCLFETILSTSQDYINARTERKTIYDYVQQGRACKDIDSLTLEILGMMKES